MFLSLDECPRQFDPRHSPYLRCDEEENPNDGAASQFAIREDDEMVMFEHGGAAYYRSEGGRGARVDELDGREEAMRVLEDDDEDESSHPLLSPSTVPLSARNPCPCSPSSTSSRSLVSVACILAHSLFLLGQLLPLYHFEGNGAMEDVSVEGHLDLLHWSLNHSFADQQGTATVADFTFVKTLSSLWTMKEDTWVWRNKTGSLHDHNFDISTTYSTALFFILLLLSGVWPHLKLLMVHVLFYVRLRFSRKERRRILFWTDFFGKYSMADLFAALLLIVYLHLQPLEHTATQILTDNILAGLPEFVANSTNVTALSETLCSILPREGGKRISPILCHALLPKILSNPTALRALISMAEKDVKVTGNVGLGLVVVSDIGIYFFTAAVVLTLLISALMNLGEEMEQDGEEQIAYERERRRGEMERRRRSGTISAGKGVEGSWGRRWAPDRVSSRDDREFLPVLTTTTTVAATPATTRPSTNRSMEGDGRHVARGVVVTAAQEDTPPPGGGAPPTRGSSSDPRRPHPSAVLPSSSCPTLPPMQPSKATIEYAEFYASSPGLLFDPLFFLSFRALVAFSCWIGSLLLLGAIFFVWPLARRTVPGTVDEVLALALNTSSLLQEDFTLGDTLRMATQGGGGNLFAALAFAFFVGVAPLLVLLLSGAVLFLRMGERRRGDVARAARGLMSFVGLEIFALVMWLMQEDVPTLTRPIIIEQDSVALYPICRDLETIIQDNPRGGLCFEVDVNLLPGFFLLLALAVLLPTGLYFLVLPMWEERRVRVRAHSYLKI